MEYQGVRNVSFSENFHAHYMNDLQGIRRITQDNS